MTKEQISQHVYRTIAYVEKHCWDSPKSARSQLDRLYGWVSGAVDASGIDDDKWVISLYQTIEANLANYQD